MKKILMITLEFPPTIGGIASYVHNLAMALDPESVVVLAEKPNASLEWDAQQPYKIIRKKLLYPRFLWPRWVRLFFHVRKIVKQEKIEIIFVHHMLPVGYVAWFMKIFFNTPYIVFSHGTDYIKSTRNAWKRSLTKMVLLTAKLVVFNSESLKGHFLGTIPELAGKSLVIYPCPDKQFLVTPSTDRISRLTEQYALAGKRVMLSVSRVNDGKGFPHLLKLMPELVKKIPNLVWLVVGDGPKLNALIKESQKLALQNTIRFIGAVPHSELNDYYHLGEVFVLLTHPDEVRGEEGFGMVFLEAAAAGLPCIAGRSGGVEEAVIQGQTGIMVDIYQGKQVLAAITQMFAESEYAKRLGVAARERVEADFQWQHQVEKLRAFIV